MKERFEAVKDVLIISGILLGVLAMVMVLEIKDGIKERLL